VKGGVWKGIELELSKIVAVREGGKGREGKGAGNVRSKTEKGGQLSKAC